MRIHIVTALYTLFFARFYHFSQSQFGLIIVSIVLVIFAEMINTAMEAVVALWTSSYNGLAKIAKDVAAGAVLLCALFALCVGISLFFSVEKIVEIFNLFCAHPWWIVLLSLSIVIAALFIFAGPDKLKKHLKRNLTPLG